MELPRLIPMEVSTNGRSDCHFRILANRRVKYITIKAGALDAESLDDMPLDFQRILPPLPYQEDTWTSAVITREPSSNKLESTLSPAALPGVSTVWHPVMTDNLDIQRTNYLTLLTQECTRITDASPETMIAKMARFCWEIQYMEAETRIFLGHIHEAGRVIGFLLEKIPDGRHAEPADLESCKAALRRLHVLGFLHGDCNKYNFIIRPSGKIVLIDFDKARACADPALMEAEMASLEGQLAETTGRGGGLMSLSLGGD